MKLSNREWKPFKIEKLFAVNKGIYLNNKNIIDGNIPYITATSTNNGINDFIGNGVLFSKDTITIEKISLSAYYQPHDYYCSHDVSVIQNENLDKYISLFVATMIKRQGIKYSYGRQAQMNVVKRETIFLPVDDSNNPDWSFMRDYIKNTMKTKKRHMKNM
ncbi:type I restriction modification DNA specificity domain protein [[Clostridium] sordellii ATCC 9714]|nr:type I restriction modification DNA specificity domain protein [[Clostridium] sordellii ATCC 9714] [Paeniclostridium sordellii ATCC 9714]